MNAALSILILVVGWLALSWLIRRGRELFCIEVVHGRVRIVRGEIARLVVEDDRLTGVALTDGRVIARTAVFIRPGNVPHADGLLTGLRCEVDQAGFVTVDATGRTSTFGVWAAGNVVDPRAQVITAAGTGSAAAIAINADLVQEDVERAAENRAAGGAPSPYTYKEEK